MTSCSDLSLGRSRDTALRSSGINVNRSLKSVPLPLLLFGVGVLFVAIANETQAASQIMLLGSITRKCTLDVTADANAASLPLATVGAQRIRVGTATQDCNGRQGFILDVASTNCLNGSPGGKFLDPVSTETLRYSIEANNPTTGGSAAVVTGLLATACTGQVARDVTNGIIHNEVSTLYVNYTGSAALSAGTYQDVLTVTLTTK